LQATANFTGRWLYQAVIGPGVTRDTTYFLKQNGESLTGAIVAGFRTQDISEGRVNGSDASWVVITGTGDQQRRVEYHVVVKGEELSVTSSAGARGGAGAQPTAVTAKRISMDGTPVNPIAGLPKVALPALHDVADGGLARTPPMGWNSWNK